MFRQAAKREVPELVEALEPIRAAANWATISAAAA
jgi:hypothetical protein